MSDPVNAKAISDRILRRDQRRMWILAILCIIAWMIVVMLPWATILPMMARVMKHQAESSISSTPPSETPEQRTELLRIVKTGTTLTFLDSIAAMFFAAVCTIGLVLHSRRATMRQVNARLADISAQLKLLAERGK